MDYVSSAIPSIKAARQLMDNIQTHWSMNNGLAKVTIAKQEMCDDEKMHVCTVDLDGKGLPRFWARSTDRQEYIDNSIMMFAHTKRELNKFLVERRGVLGEEK